MDNRTIHADLIGRPHTDGRLITCISSVRNSIKTEIFDGNPWLDLPLTRNSLAIFPGRGLEKYGIHNLAPHSVFKGSRYQAGSIAIKCKVYFRTEVYREGPKPAKIL